MTIRLAMICEDLSPEMGGQAVSIPLLGEHLEKTGVKVKYFSGVNSLRHGKVKSNETRILAVLAYNDKPGVSLSTSAQMTFYGKSEN